MELPPLPQIRATIQGYARVLSTSRDELGTRPLVLPNNEYFPDEVGREARGVKKLVARMKRHAGLSDIPTKTRVLTDEDSCGGEGCGGGGCGNTSSSCSSSPHSRAERLIDEGDVWRIQIPEAELAHPTVLVTNLARVLSYLFLLETLPEGVGIPAPQDVTADLAGVALGFGVLLLEGSHIHTKSCGGPRVTKLTKLDPGDLAVATALFARIGGHATRKAERELPATQAALLGEARAFVESNEALIQALRDDPGLVARGQFELQPTKGWLSRVASGKRRDPKRGARDRVPDDPVAELEELLTTMPERKPVQGRKPPAEDDELRALVEEALAER